MNTEIALREHIFRFLRSPDYVTDVNHYLPKFLKSDPAFSETQRVLSWEHERYRLKIIDFAKQFHPQTATWGLSVWEEELGLPTDLSVDLEIRRARVMAKLLGSSPMTVENTNRLVNLFTDDGKAYVDELPEPGVIRVVIPSQVAYTDEMRNALDERLPAELDYYFQHRIIIDVDDDTISGGDGTIDGGSDSVADINDNDGTDGSSAFFIQVDSPIIENIPYGSWYNTPKYDGSVRCSEINSFTGNIKYDGTYKFDGLNSSIERYAENCGWWFASNGESQYNKEFQYDGVIKYNGKRPYKIEYNNDMDELAKIEINQKIEEDVSRQLQFDGSVRFDGNASYNSESIPTDSSGDIEITKYRRYNGKICYDGAGVNLNDGSLKFNGLFDYSGGGERAQIETFTDDISGNFELKTPEKSEPFGLKYPEFSDDVPTTTDKQSLDIDVGEIAGDDVGVAIQCDGKARFDGSIAYDDTKHTIVDNGGELQISKVHKYDGGSQYNGGDINYFNGAIKANGNFNFDGGGNKATIEVITVDLADDFSLTRKIKTAPLVYVENVDNINRIEDEISLRADTNFSDNVNVTDSGGKLIVRRRAKYDGRVQYYRDFDYPADGTKYFDGTLDYDNIYRVIADGRAEFNGDERYGGRANSDYIEQVLDFDELPIATHTRLGYVIAGENLDIDGRGLITLPQRFTNRMTTLESGRLAAIFENWRRQNEI